MHERYAQIAQMTKVLEASGRSHLCNLDMDLITRHTEGTVLDWLEEKLGASGPSGPPLLAPGGGSPTFQPQNSQESLRPSPAPHDKDDWRNVNSAIR